MKNIIFAPHLDDAVLSCGGLIRLFSEETLVITVFAGFYNGLTDWDRKCGFNNSQNPMKVRREEDKIALEGLGCLNYKHLDYLSPSLSKQMDLSKCSSSHSDIAEELKKIILEKKTAQNIYFPLGIGHLAHIKLRKIFINFIKEKEFSKYKFFAYEDFPYVKVLTKELEELISQLKQDFTLNPSLVDINKVLDEKVSAILKYKTQIPVVLKAVLGVILGTDEDVNIKKVKKALLDYCFEINPKKVSERYWLLKKKDES